MQLIRDPQWAQLQIIGGWMSWHPWPAAAALSQLGPQIPSGQRCCRTSLKHLASSIRAEGQRGSPGV
jgi:hypothetical protein